MSTAIALAAAAGPLLALATFEEIAELCMSIERSIEKKRRVEASPFSAVIAATRASGHRWLTARSIHASIRGSVVLATYAILPVRAGHAPRNNPPPRGLGDRVGLVELHQLGVKLIDSAAETLVARDHLVGVLTREIEVRIVHLGRERGAFRFLLLDLGFQLGAPLRDTRPAAFRVALSLPLRVATPSASVGACTIAFRVAVAFVARAAVRVRCAVDIRCGVAVAPRRDIAIRSGRLHSAREIGRASCR